MINGKRVLAIVPARGGSKGIHLKNLRCIDGKPLVSLAAEVALAVPEIDRKIVSTDHPEIAKVSIEAGLCAPFQRPLDLSEDIVADWDVLAHGLGEMERLDEVQYDIVVMLQPTSPLRTPQDISGAINLLVSGGYDAVWSVTATDSKAHPYKQLTVVNQMLEYWDPMGKEVIARQQLEPVYHRNGVVYALSRECLLKQGTIKGMKTGAYVIDGAQISIDTEFDIFLVENHIAYLKKCQSYFRVDCPIPPSPY